MRIEPTIKVSENVRKRTFTIRKQMKGKTYSKFRTYPMRREEFENERYNTERDWKQFLRATEDYYILK